MITSYLPHSKTAIVTPIINPSLFSPIQNCFTPLLSTLQRVMEVAFAIFSDIALLPSIGALVIWMTLAPSFDPLFIKKDKTPILFLHGSGFNESQWIAGKWLLDKPHYGSFFSVSYDEGLITNNAKDGIDDCAIGKVRDKILHIQKVTGRKDLILIAHSMGGLVGSYYAERCAQKDQSRIRHIISIGTPWQGTPLISYLPTLKSQGKRYVQMHPQNAFREKLLRDALVSEKQKKRTYYTIASKGDFIVPFPYSLLSPTLAHQKNFSSLGHFGIVVFPQVWKQVATWLDAIYL